MSDSDSEFHREIRLSFNTWPTDSLLRKRMYYMQGLRAHRRRNILDTTNDASVRAYLVTLHNVWRRNLIKINRELSSRKFDFEFYD